MDLTQYLQYAAALFFVLALIGIFAWVARRMRGGGKSALPGSGGRHLGVIEAAAIDAQRRLVLVRRDHVGHLLLIGGGQDVLIETDIPLGVARETFHPQQAALPPDQVQAVPEQMAAEQAPHMQQPVARPMAPVARPQAPIRQPDPNQPAPAPQAAPPLQPQPQQVAAPAAPMAPAQQQAQHPNLMQVRPGEGVGLREDK